MGNKYYKRPPVSLLYQKTALCAAYTDSHCEIRGKKLIWVAKIRPTPFSKTYTVMITYRLWESPRVWVIGDELEKLEAIDFPHKYEIDAENKRVRICLYRYNEFNVFKVIANTVVPWTVEWLYFYELWLATGEWFGGGEHPNVGKTKNDEEK